MKYSDATWLYVASVSFAVGIFVRSFYEVGLVVVVGLCLVAVGLVTRRGVAPPRRLFLSLTIFCLSIGILRMEWASWSEIIPVLENQVGEKVLLQGVIKREPDLRTNSIHLYVETKDGLVLVMAQRGGVWNYGDRVTVEGKLKKPESFETDLGREFNYPGYLLSRGVSYLISFAEVEKIASNEGSDLIARILTVKHSFMRRLEQFIPEPQVGLGEGLLLGVKKALGEDLETAFRRTGIIHIVVLSGYNVMIVVTFILYVLGRVFGRRLSVLFGLIGIVLFAVMVGLGATVVRASVMAGLLLLMGLTGRMYLVLRGLMVAGVVMLFFNPYALAFDVGFQLSFLATLGLIIVSPYLSRGLGGVPTFLGMREFLTATLATQLFVLPLLLYQMGEFSIVAVVVNVLVLPMVAVAMLLTFLTGIVSFVSVALVAPLAFVTYLSLSYIIIIAEWFAELPFASFTVSAFSFWFVPCAYAVLAYIFWRIKQEPDELKGWVIVEIV